MAATHFFDPDMPDAFNADDVVARHEAGHVCTWIHYGGGVGSVEFHIEFAGLVQGMSECVQHSELTVGHRQFLDWSTERRLAGELAARRYLSLPMDRVSVGHPEAARWNRLDSVMDALGAIPEKLTDKHDAVRLLMAARDSKRRDWLEWLQARLISARDVVEANQTAIELLGRILERHIQQVRERRRTSIRVSAYDVFRTVRGKVQHDANAPAARELLDAEVREPIRRRIARMLRGATGRYWPVEVRSM
jgi:hypothetical protein